MISLLCLHRFLLDKGLVDFIVLMHNRYTVQCKLHRFIFNFRLVRTTSHQIATLGSFNIHVAHVYFVKP